MRIEVNSLKVQKEYLRQEFNALSSKNAKTERQISEFQSANKKLVSTIDSLRNECCTLVANQKTDKSELVNSIDKFLKCMGNEKSVFMFFFVGIDETGIVNTVLASVFHDKLQNTTLLQHHWAGRGTRGTAQFNGKTINELLYDEQFENNINDNESKSFLQKLLNR